MKRTTLLSGLLRLSLILSVNLAPAQNFRNTQDVLRSKAGPMAKVGADLIKVNIYSMADEIQEGGRP